MIRPVALLCCLAAAALAEDRPLLHPLFADHMVLPAGRPVPVWGWTAPGARVTVAVAGATGAAVAGPDGAWRAELPALPPGGPYRLAVDGPQDRTLDDVLVGEVWLCSGQSNMAMGLSKIEGAAEEQAEAERLGGAIRLFDLGQRLAGTPQTLPGPGLHGPLPVPLWRRASATAARSFSAVGWTTGRELHRRLGVPVGLVACAWGGTNIRAWMPEEALEGLGMYADERASLRRLVSIEAAGGKPVPALERDAIDAWWQANDPGTAAGWQAPAEPASGAWSVQAVPGSWAHGGATWLRRRVALPPAAAGRGARLVIGGFADEHVAWVGGRQVGFGRGPDTRTYQVPAAALAGGEAVVALRVWSPAGWGRAAGDAAGWRLEIDGGTTVPLAGEWRMARGAPAAPERPKSLHQGSNGGATMLWNAGIRPLAPFPFSGMLWYQGEQDSGRGDDYRRLLPALIAAWRGAFGADLPVVLVALPGWKQPVADPVQAKPGFGLIRVVQAETARTLPGVGLAVTTDLGDRADVHPLRKREVGARAAAAAIALRTGQGGGGPLITAAEAVPGGMRLRLERIAGGGLAIEPGTPSGFALAGADGVWRHAVATVEGEAAVLVTSPEVPQPKAVRYGWADFPPTTLRDRAGQPAAPFASDR